MVKRFKFKLTSNQWQVLYSAISHISQGVILFALGAIFVPQTVSLQDSYPKQFGIIIFTGGLILLLSAIIMSKDRK
jgi:predicted membrane channel-forming protein YqfA (hemolysin III family)